MIPENNMFSVACHRLRFVLPVLVVVGLSGCATGRRDLPSDVWQPSVPTREQKLAGIWIEQNPGIYATSETVGLDLLDASLERFVDVKDFVRRNGRPSHIVVTGADSPFWLVYRSRKVCVRRSGSELILQTVLEMRDQYALIIGGAGIDFEPAESKRSAELNSSERNGARKLELVVSTPGENLASKVSLLREAIFDVHSGFTQRLRSTREDVSVEHTEKLMQIALLRTELLLNWENTATDIEASKSAELSELAWYRVSIAQYVRALERVAAEVIRIESRVALERTLKGAASSSRLRTSLINALAAEYERMLRRN